ncbi:MAG: hydroxypyruvate isomerase family protein [Planctomycetota bacterium]|jgi:hydroxypyruvate isomerase
MKDQKKNIKREDRRISRRSFLGSAAAAVALSTRAAKAQMVGKSASKQKFKLKYAPSLGQFKRHAGEDLIDRIKFMADEGFSAMFDNWVAKKSKEKQEAIARVMSQLGMTLGPFIAVASFGKKTFVTRNQAVRDELVSQMKRAVEVGKRVNGKWALVVPGRFDEGLEWAYQTANMIDNLKYCAEVCEASGLIMVIEPLNPWRNHPGLFLTKIAQAYQICRAVGSPYCKILNDIYHQQITEGNLIPNIDMAWEEIAAFHIGDTPGRKEPGTGEINYKNVFKHIHKKGYQGVLCMEHGSSKRGKEGERAVIDAYQACDSF